MTFVAASPNSPAQNAEKYLERAHWHEHRWTLLRHRDSFYEWTGTHWEPLDDETLKARLWMVYKDAVFPVPLTADGNPPAGAREVVLVHDVVGEDGEVTQEEEIILAKDFEVTRAKRDEVFAGLISETLVDRSVDTPTWLKGNRPHYPEGFSARDTIACRNGLVHAPTHVYYKNTPKFFNHFSCPFDYDPDAGAEPERWLAFLDETFDKDVEQIGTLQEIFGLLLTTRTDFQKIFYLLGPPRSGKGTLVRVLTSMLGGEQNVATVSMNDLNNKFGLSALVSKNLATMADMRFRSRDDGQALERLLSISGEDWVSIEAKGKDAYNARLSTRLFMVSNELPKLNDDSNALKSRFILLKTPHTVPEEKRDPELTDKLLAELTQIFNWALVGLDRLSARGRFEQPKAGNEDLRQINELSSPISVFVEELCTVNPLATVRRDELFAAWREWCNRTGHHPGSTGSFGRSIRAAVPTLSDRKPTVPGQGQVRMYGGLTLNEEGKAAQAGLDWAGALGASAQGS